MSGFEIVGVVLGGMPLIISALEHYTDGVQSVIDLIRYRRVLEGYRNDLEAESTMFQNTLVLLLSGFGSASEVKDLVKDKTGRRWRDVHVQDGLNNRLGDSLSIFLKVVNTMNNVLDSFKERLGIDEDGEIPWLERRSLLKAVEAGKLVFRRGAHDDLIKRLKDGNQTLERLSYQTAAIQSLHRTARDGKKLDRLRQYASSLYAAVERALTCQCKDQHRSGLSLEVDMSQAAGKSFEIILPQKASPVNNQRKWMPLTIEVVEQDPQLGAVPDPVTITAAVKKGKADSNPAKLTTHFKKLRFATASQSSSTTAQNRNVVPPTQAIPTPLAPLTNLCQSLESLKTFAKSNPMGTISDASFQFLVSTNDVGLVGTAAPPQALNDILNDQKQSKWKLHATDRLKLGAAASLATLGLYESPWIRKGLSKSSIFLLEASNRRFRAFFTADTAMVDAALPVTNAAVTVPRHIRNKSLFTLGIFLIELLCKKSIAQLCNESSSGVTTDSPDLAAQYETAVRLLDDGEVHNEGGDIYGDIVNHCIRCDFVPAGKADLQDETFRRNVFEKIVLGLYDWAKTFGRLP